MSVQYNIEKYNASFLRVFRWMITAFAVFTCIYLIVLTYAILKNNPGYLHDWRGTVCILLTGIAFLLYGISVMRGLKLAWPASWPFALGMWSGIYLVVLLLALIDRNFLWGFYVVFSVSFTLFAGWRTVFAVSIMAFTMFAFQGLLTWPPDSSAILSLIGQMLMLFSSTGLVLLFQRLMEERFAREHLLEQLAQRNSELEAAHRQLAQSAAQEQELAVLRERTRLAREIHDTVGHALVLISIQLEAAQRLRERDPERCHQEIESTKRIARETMTALRASIANLRSPILEHEPLSQALSRAVGELACRSGLQVTCTLQTGIDLLPEALKETIWKVSQEALTNIEKHAHASHVQVSISQQGEKLLLSIHDDGIGLTQSVYQPQSEGSFTDNCLNGRYGLRGMCERVEAIGGHLTLHSSKEQGTAIDVELPLASDVV
jgi:signal transduction histidine kinase